MAKKSKTKNEAREEQILLVSSYIALKHLHRLVESAEEDTDKVSNKKSKSRVKNILRRLRFSLSGSEEYAERRLAMVSKEFEEDVKRISHGLTRNEIRQVNVHIHNSDVFNALLAKDDSRGGEIEKLLRKAVKASTVKERKQLLGNIKKKLDEDIEADKAFQVEIGKIVAILKKAKVNKQKMDLSRRKFLSQTMKAGAGAVVGATVIGKATKALGQELTGWDLLEREDLLRQRFGEHLSEVDIGDLASFNFPIESIFEYLQLFIEHNLPVIGFNLIRVIETGKTSREVATDIEILLNSNFPRISDITYHIIAGYDANLTKEIFDLERAWIRHYYDLSCLYLRVNNNQDVALRLLRIEVNNGGPYINHVADIPEHSEAYIEQIEIIGRSSQYDNDGNPTGINFVYPYRLEQEIEEGNIETLAQFLQVNDGFLLNMTDLISFRNQYNVRLLQRVINIKRDGERLFRSIMDLPGHLPQTIGMMESLARERNNGEYVYQSGAEIRRHILENQ